MKIKVKQNHIKQGKPGYCELCPVALALKDAGVKYASVDITDIGGDFTGEFKYWDTPRKVANFIVKFDSGRTVSPFEFELK